MTEQERAIALRKKAEKKASKGVEYSAQEALNEVLTDEAAYQVVTQPKPRTRRTRAAKAV